MQALAGGLAACMGIDVAHILRQGRFELRGLRVRLDARRAPEPPRRFESIDLHFLVEGNVPEDRVARAIELSRNTYCSAWNSLRQDIVLRTRFEVRREAE
jgi:putative redox protein